MKKLLLGVFMVGLLFTNGGTAYACSCVPPGPPAESLAQSDAVFAGTVTGIDQPIVSLNSADPVEVTFAVSQSWKGPSGTTLEVYTAQSSASCGYNFEQGKEYLVYAYQTDDGYHTGLCSRTALLSDASEDVQALNAAADQEPSSPNDNPGDEEPVDLPSPAVQNAVSVPPIVIYGGLGILAGVIITLLLVNILKK